MKASVQKTGKERKHGGAISGPRVAKDLLRALRDMREVEAEQNPNGVFYRSTEEIERWEDVIRETAKADRRAAREVLCLDSETTAALDEACGMQQRRRGFACTDDAIVRRRALALRAIKAVCLAFVGRAMNEHDSDVKGYDFAVSLRPMSDEEKAAELMVMRAAITAGGEGARR